MLKPKIAIIGAGNIGGNIAYLLACRLSANILLFDPKIGVAKGKALDIMHASKIFNTNVEITGTDNYQDMIDAKVVFVTAGVARKPGMSREDLLHVNAQIIQEIGQNIKIYAPHAFLIVVTNPIDAMAPLMQKISGLPHKMVLGMAGTLDASRFCYFLGVQLEVAPTEIETIMLGGHSDTMLPLISCTTIKGIPLLELIDQQWITLEQIQYIIARTKAAGAEIVSLMQHGSAYYAPAAAALEIAESYLFNQQKIRSCTTLLQGEYGICDLYLGAPVVIGERGAQKVIEISLNHQEKAQLAEAAVANKALISQLAAFGL